MPRRQQEPTPEQQQGRKENQQEQEQRAEELRQQFEREQDEDDAGQARRHELQRIRQANFERMIDNAPVTLTAPQLRVLLRALLNLDPYTLADDLVQHIGIEGDAGQRVPETVLLDAIDATADEKLTGFAIRLALAGHVGLPREGEVDSLTEAAALFAPLKPKKSNQNKSPQTCSGSPNSNKAL